MSIPDEDKILMNLPMEVKQLLGNNQANVVVIGKVVIGSPFDKLPSGSAYRLLSAYGERRLQNLICLAVEETRGHFHSVGAAASYLGISRHTVERYMAIAAGKRPGKPEGAGGELGD